MSLLLDRAARSPWETHPGWGITVDLTPRQVVAARQAKATQRLVASALLLVVVLCAGAGLLATAERSSAQDDYDAEQTRTAQLAAEAARYNDITTMENVTERVAADLSTAMAGDVDVVNLFARIDQARPVGVRISDQSVVLTAPTPESTPAPSAGTDAGGAATSTPSTGSTGGTDGGTAATPPATGPQVVGALTVTGTADQIASVTPYISVLNRLRGITDVLPTSVAETDAGVTYTITMNLTDELYTQRWTEAAQ